MQTINYQGQEMQAALVNYLSGNIPTSTVDHDGDEELFRDERGCYYLRRQLNRLDTEGEDRQASGRTLIHRINVNAAILWATTRLNSDTLDLRNDAASLLMEGRGYQDPHPSHLSVEQRAMVFDPNRFAKVSQEANLEPQPTRGRIVVELDDHASDLLREHLTDNPADDPRDVVSAALDFMLGVEIGENWHTDGAIAAAKARRLGLEGGEEVAA